ncbi:MAG: TrbC/VirB2 family protein [Geminicoccaceae bacterium]
MPSAKAQAGASGLPWETPLQTITDSMSGPVLQSMLILAILVSGVMIAFTEVGAGAKPPADRLGSADHA